MDIRADNRRTADHEPDPTGGVVEAMNRRLNDLDESRAFGEHWTCIRWWEIGVTWWLIRGLRNVGLAKNIVLPPSSTGSVTHLD